jgi:hypothetical protein
MEEFTKRLSKLPSVDLRTEDEILAYSERGYPESEEGS